MTPKETSKSMEALAKIGVTAEEASAGMDRISKVLYEITVEELEQ